MHGSRRPAPRLLRERRARFDRISYASGALVRADAAPEPELQVTLVGVIISSEEQIAIVRLNDGGRFARLSEGDSFQGWVLDSIEPSRITFRRGDVEEIIELTYDVPPPVQKPKRRKRRQRNQRNQDPAQVQPDTQQN